MHTQSTPPAPYPSGSLAFDPEPCYEGPALSYGELAVALYASDMPTKRFGRDDLATADIAAWVNQGTARLGIDNVCCLDTRTWELNFRYLHRGTETKRERNEFRQMWPSARRRDIAYGLAWRFVSTGTDG